MVRYGSGPDLSVLVPNPHPQPAQIAHSARCRRGRADSDAVKFASGGGNICAFVVALGEERKVLDIGNIG